MNVYNYIVLQVEKHEYKYSLHDKYGVDDLGGGVGGDGHLVLPAAPLGKHADPYNPDSIAGISYISYNTLVVISINYS